MSDAAASTPPLAPVSEIAPSPTAPKRPAAKKRVAAAKPVWVVRKGFGLEQLAPERAKTAIAAGKARAATDRDLEVAGVDPTQR